MSDSFEIIIPNTKVSKDTLGKMEDNQMDQLTVTEHEAMLKLWIRRIKECRGSGMTVKAWCRENEINDKTYYYWLRKIKKEAFEALPSECKQVPAPFGEKKTFAEVNAPVSVCTANIAATIDMGRMRVDVHNGADEITLQNIFRIISAYAG